MPRSNPIPSRTTKFRRRRTQREKNLQHERERQSDGSSTEESNTSAQASPTGSSSNGDCSAEDRSRSSISISSSSSSSVEGPHLEEGEQTEIEEGLIENEEAQDWDMDHLRQDMHHEKYDETFKGSSEVEVSEDSADDEDIEDEEDGNICEEGSAGEDCSDDDEDEEEETSEEGSAGDYVSEDEEEAGPNNQDIPDDYDPPLYRGAPITLGQSLLLILTYSVVHNLSGVALGDLLGLIALHCIDADNKCKKTLYAFKQFFVGLKSPLKFHYFCSCFLSLPSKDSLCDVCCDATKVCSFIEIPIISQLSKLLNRKGFYTNLAHRRRRVKSNPNNYEDIYDSNVYREKVQSGEIDSDTITFCWNVDGVKIFKSTNLEIWPVYLAINELPYHLRFKKENCLIAGIWCGPSSKPSVSLFLRSFHSQLSQLFRGVNFDVPGNADPVRLRGFILCGTCDLPAKACFLKWNSHSGYYSCNKCTIRGEKSERTDYVMAFPPDNNAVKRSMKDTLEHAVLADQSGKTIFGVKGISDLKLYVKDYIRTTSIDVMHCVWEGVGKKLARLWFDEEFKNHNFSLFSVVDQVSHILVSLTPPSFVRRMPRSLTEHLAYWKAQEFKTFLLYYSVPILSGIMSPLYFNHHLLLVHGVFLLNQKSVSPEKIEEAEKCLQEYVNQFAELYHLKFLSLNFHLLTHLGEVVRDLGPLWVTSCMPFEDLNGLLKKIVHGTRHASSQISSGLSQAMTLPIMLDRLGDEHPVKRWCNNVFCRNRLKITELISDNLWALGKFSKLSYNPPVIATALEQCGMEGKNILQFSRFKRGRVVFSSQAYTRQTKSNSTIVKFRDHDESVKYGIVHTYLRICECDCEVKCRCNAAFYAVICILKTRIPFEVLLHPSRPVSHVMHAFNSQNIAAIPLSNILSLCVSLTLHGTHFILDLVNIVEDE